LRFLERVLFSSPAIQQPAFLQNAVTVGDVITPAVSSVDKGVIPIRVEKRAQCMGEMMVEEEKPGLLREIVFHAEAPGIEKGVCTFPAVSCVPDKLTGPASMAKAMMKVAEMPVCPLNERRRLYVSTGLPKLAVTPQANRSNLFPGNSRLRQGFNDSGGRIAAAVIFIAGYPLQRNSAQQAVFVIDHRACVMARVNS